MTGQDLEDLDKVNVMNFSITLKNHLKVTAFTWQTSLMLLIGGHYFLGFDSETLLVVFLFTGIFVFPSLYLHGEYWIANYRQAVDISNQSLVITKKGVSTNYPFSEMDQVILYKGMSLEKGGIPTSPLEYYNYARIILKTGEEIILTCLLSPHVNKITDQITGVKRERKKHLFNTIYWK